MKPPASCILYTHVLLSHLTLFLLLLIVLSPLAEGASLQKTQFTSLTPLACIGFLTSVVGRNHGTTLFCGAEQIHQISLVDDVAERIACCITVTMWCIPVTSWGLWAPSRDIYIYHRPYIVPIVALQVIKPSLLTLEHHLVVASTVATSTSQRGLSLQNSSILKMQKMPSIPNLWTITGHQLLGISWMPYSVHWCRILKMTSRSTLWLFNIAMENRPIFKFGKPSISIRAIVITMANCECHNQMLTSINFTFFGDINRCRRFVASIMKSSCLGEILLVKSWCWDLHQMDLRSGLIQKTLEGGAVNPPSLFVSSCCFREKVGFFTIVNKLVWFFHRDIIIIWYHMDSMGLINISKTGI